MELLRNWLWRRRYRKWHRSVGMNLSPKKLIFAMSGVTNFMRGVSDTAMKGLDRWASGNWFGRD